MKKQVYIKVSYQLLDEFSFLQKLIDYVGDIRFEAQDINDAFSKQVAISFYTDKVEIKEGESRQVVLIMKRKENSDDWDFTSIEKV